jgi:carboxyl-terminal processing protease
MIKLRQFCFLLSLFFLICCCEAKPPQLTPHDARIKIDEILKAHVSHQKLTPDLMKRALQNYLDELDPIKTYFIETELLAWVNPTEELLKRALAGYYQETFLVFEEIHSEMLKAIQRRNDLESKIILEKLPKHIDPIEFKDLCWAKDEEELFQRLVDIRGLQLETADKLNQESGQQFLQRLNKRRLKREEELITASDSERQQLILALVLKAVSSALDSQTAYFTPGEANQFMIQVQQRLFGIGAQLRDDLSGFTVLRLLEGGPAGVENKLRIGDRIIAVDGELVIGMDITEAVELIRGQEGTPVLLTILRESGEGDQKKEEKIDIEIVRGEVILKESRLETSYEPYGDGIKMLKALPRKISPKRLMH